MIDDLLSWLRAQLDEDERIAKAARSEPWSFYPDGHCGAARDFLNRWNPEDPDLVLQEVEAKRRWLDELLRLPHYVWDGREEYGCPKATDVEIWRQIFEGDQVCNCGRDEHVDRSLRLLALPYTDRPGYLEAWRP